MTSTGYQKKDNSDRLADRYQAKSWWVRRWRDRWLLTIPYTALRLWFGTRTKQALARPDLYVTRESLPNCWSVACGIVDGRRDYWYTAEEVFTRLRERLKEKTCDKP